MHKYTYSFSGENIILQNSLLEMLSQIFHSEEIGAETFSST